MPPTLVRPQTFDPTTRLDMPRKPRHPSRSLQSPDSASPAVRFQLKLFSTCCDSVLPRHASYKSCSWGKPPKLRLGMARKPRHPSRSRPHFCAFLSRTSYAVFSRCIVLTSRVPLLSKTQQGRSSAWFSLFSTKILYNG